MKYSGFRKLLCEYLKLLKFIFLSFSDTRRTRSILVYKFSPERTGFKIDAEYTRPQLTFLALVP